MLRYQSHRGEETVAACVVFGPDGPLKSDYRRFNIKGIEPGDDYAAIGQVGGTPLYPDTKRGSSAYPA